MNNTAFFLVALAFIFTKADTLSAQLRADLTAMPANIVFNESTLYIKKEISGGGEVELITGTTEKVDCICNFDKNKLETGRAHVFSHLAVTYRADAATGQEGALKYGGSNIPAALENALLIVTQNGRVVINVPINQFINSYTPNRSDDRFTECKVLGYFVDDRNIKVNIKFPDGVSLSTATKHYVQVEFKGAETARRPNS